MEDPLYNLYPDQLIIHYKEGKAMGELQCLGFSNKSFLDIEKGEYISFVDFVIPPMSSKIVMNKELMKEKSMPSYSFNKTEESKNIAEKECFKVEVINTENDSTFFIWATDDIHIHGVNDLGPYSGFDSFMMEYQLKQFGMNATLTVTQIQEIEVEESVFSQPQSGYKIIPEEQLMSFIDSTYRSITY